MPLLHFCKWDYTEWQDLFLIVIKLKLKWVFPNFSYVDIHLHFLLCFTAFLVFLFFKCQFPRVHLKLSRQKVIISPCRAFITTCYNQCCPPSPISLSVSQRTNYNQKLLISVLLRSSSQRSSLMTAFLSKTLMLITLAANTMMKHGNHQGAA